MRVAILNRLKNDISKGVPIVEGKGNEVVETEEATEEVQPKKVTSKTDLQRWGEQGSAGWSKREDGTDLNEEEVNEEYARWDATVKEARDKRKAEKATTLLGENVDPNEGFWEFGDRPMRLQSLDLGDESDSLAEQIKTIGLAADDSEVTASNNAKTLETVSKTDASQKPEESMCEQKKRKAPEIRHTVKDGDEAGAYGELFLKAITAQDILSQESGSYTSSVYSEHGKQLIFTARCSIDMTRWNWRTWESNEQVNTSRDSNSELARDILDLMMHLSLVCTSP